MKMTSKNKGVITLGDKVMVSDPCYGLGTWCQAVLNNVLPGQYDCEVEYSDEGEWGIRVSAIEVTHINYKGKFLCLQCQTTYIGVDSGQAGIFDYEYYAKYHMDATERHHVDDDWYDRVGDLTYTKMENPKYEEFCYDLGTGSMEEMKAKFDAYFEYKNSVKSMKYVYGFDGNTIDGYGFVSSSGYGDGGYLCWVAKDENDKIVCIRVEFITDDEDEWDEV